MKENAPIKIEIENSTKNACKLEVDADIIIRIKIYDCKVGWLWKKDFKHNIKGPFKYSVIKELGGWDQKMAIHDDLQYVL